MKKLVLLSVIFIFIAGALVAQDDDEDNKRPSKKDRQNAREEQRRKEQAAMKLYPQERQDLYGYVDEKGRRRIDYEFDWGGNFSEGLAPVMKRDKYGFINKLGDVVIRYKYDDASEFSEGLAVVLDEYKYGYIDQKGNLKIDYQYDDAGLFNDGVAYVMNDGLVGYIDTAGNLLSNSWYNDVGPFFRGICEVEQDGVIKHMNNKGKIVKVDPMSCYDKVLTRAEQMPEFPGGIDSLYHFIQRKLQYPEEAGNKRIEGTVFLTAEVRKDGKITNIELVNGIGYGCDEEAIRVANLLPPFKPAMDKGENVCVSMVVTVDFTLDKYEKQLKEKNTQ